MSIAMFVGSPGRPVPVLNGSKSALKLERINSSLAMSPERMLPESNRSTRLSRTSENDIIVNTGAGVMFVDRTNVKSAIATSRNTYSSVASVESCFVIDAEETGCEDLCWLDVM